MPDNSSPPPKRPARFPLSRARRWSALSPGEPLGERGSDVVFGINLSACCLIDEEFCAFAIDAVKRSGARLYFEITETAIIDDPQRAIAAISELQEAGIRISIDDYGAGLSSLSYLKRIDADELKLDKGLIEDFKPSPSIDPEVNHRTCSQPRSEVVAEGVEEAARAVLATLNCDLIQGYLVSPPVSLEDLFRAFAPATTIAPLTSRAAAAASR